VEIPGVSLTRSPFALGCRRIWGLLYLKSKNVANVMQHFHQKRSCMARQNMLLPARDTMEVKMAELLNALLTAVLIASVCIFVISFIFARASTRAASQMTIESRMARYAGKRIE